ncbi:FtsP/CotA-like multicopper oxidase with cupredoxin domain [Kribbella amoyensis]|uniref:FtsP/CotA-like multicopper oxidase with cupredoxin domain n=1 Tax=Kribbella amoyensis TaxID=996641 RepID=A0A561B8X3_9ACTN|nr:multicopper oxidase family protein [Kribbella amoyensis]TWD75411.1 FtsP/CotA-like multicopper oxidase with cupredoxin domain [Kribbella amoyensis]
MTTLHWMLLANGIDVLNVALWFAAGITTAFGRVRPALALLAAALVTTVAKAASVAALASAGWWFVQDKVLLGLPLLVASALVAALSAGRPLMAAWRAGTSEVPAGGVLALLTAAYTALAGLAVTYLVGYPLTWGAALITVALVGFAVLLTARVLDGDTAPTSGKTPRFSRRQVLTLAGGVVVAGGAALSLRAPQSAKGPAHHHLLSVADLRGELTPALGGTTRRHVLTAQKTTVRLPSGRRLRAWTYDGQLPGPAITANQGDLIEVTLRNADIDDGVTIHWHGYDVACGEDGVPGLTQDWVAPGQEFVYHFRADQVGTYWYHTHQASAVGVRMGLYGTLVVRPRTPPAESVDLTLPVHTLDGTLLIGGQDGRMQRTITPGTAVRLRLVNTDSEPHRFGLAGTPFRVVAVDGRDLDGPGEVSDVALRLPAGGRYDVTFAMPSTSVALVVDDDPRQGLLLRPEDDATAEPSYRTGAELDLLGYGTRTAAPFATDRHFTLVLDRGLAMVDGRPAYANGRGHPSIPDHLVAEGDLVRFTVVNRGLANHPWHLHGHPVLILSRDGRRSTGSPLWVDTFDVRPGEVWEVAFRATNPGLWMNHCHNLPHADQGMMLRLGYDAITSPFAHTGTGHR